MNKVAAFTHEFVEFIPENLEPAKLYVSMEYGTAAHLCACGCGSKVVTPISPTGWQLTYDRETVSLYPSIGNWSFPCRSHYFITRNRVRWAAPMSQIAIDRGRSHDQAARDVYYGKQPAPTVVEDPIPSKRPWWRFWG